MNFSDMISKNHEGAGYVFLTPDNLVLVLLKPNGKYTFAGGHREKKETPLQTANRETVEELGFLPKGRTIDYIKYTKKETDKICYSFIMKVDKLFIPEISNEHKSFMWIPISELSKIKLSKSVVNILPKLFKKLK